MKRRNFIKTTLSLGSLALMGGEASAEEAAPVEIPEDLTGQNPPEGFKKVKIAQIGVRHGHASGKMASLKKLPKYFEIVGIAAESPEDEKAHRNDGVYAGLKWLTQDEILNSPEIEAVCVETEIDQLMPTAARVARAGKPMHVDKPLGQSMEECHLLIDACRETGVLMQPGYMFRTNQAMRLLIRAIKNGWLGEIHDICGDMNRNDVDPGYRTFRSRYRGGGLYFFGSHLVDLIVEAMGEPQDVQAFERPDPKDHLQDNTLAVMLYEKAICEVRTSMRKIDGIPTRRLVAHGTKGSFVLDPLENTNPLNVTLTLDEPHDEFQKGVNHVKLEPFHDRYFGQLIELALCIRGLKKYPYTLDYELLSEKAILAASGYIPWSK